MEKQDFKKFVLCLMKASEKIDANYFKLPVSEGESTYRERVYCYELYHQLRCTLGDSFPYKLNGEVDKIDHPIIKKAKKPDFIFHIPGSMKHNFVVIEVKPITVKDEINELKKDIQKLKYFLNKVRYYRAIIIVYGNLNDITLPQNIKMEIESISDKRIMVLWHREPHETPEIIRG